MTKRRKAGLILAAVFGAMTLVTSIALPIGYHYESVIDEFLGTSEYAIKKKSSDSEAAMPYKSEFNSVEELREKEAHVNRQMEGEGLTLLKNENNALPLVKGSKFSVFGNGLFDPVLSGTGSGAIKQGEDSYTLTKALNESFGAKSVNSVLRNKYKDLKEKYHSVNANIATGKSSDFQVNEAPWSEVVDQEVRESFKDYSDCALFIITRRGGEGTDLPDGSSEELKSSDPTTIDGDFLRLTTTEKDIFAQIKKLKEEGVFRKFVVLINSSNALQLDFLDDEGIDACMWIGTVGNNGLAAVGDALVGDINPSGRLADTFLIDNHSSLSMRNFGIFEYENPNNYDLGKAISNSDLVGDYDKCNQDYLVYQESIYVGYKYFETRYEDSVKS